MATTGSSDTEPCGNRTARERRRSERRAVRIPLLLEAGGVRDVSWTVIANEGGALVTFARPLRAGERVVVHNVATGRTAVARVVTALLANSAGAGERSATEFRMTLRFETPPGRFWGPAYDRAGPEPAS